ncbi:MAG TPA: cob(I)yrinic acid a,c-diamide adenosyltransferase [Burkholderiales bacterium]|nr:cob(I)yrinic acid a,c-diamide adenosyltransferase [Burkholderiales bacterium]
MGNRLSKITTRTGDSGDTGLGDGARVGKDSLRIQLLGDVDELNSCLGLLLAEKPPRDVHIALLRVQQDLFDLGGEVCIPGHSMITAAQVARLEALTQRHNAKLKPLKEFILPGGTRAAAAAHLARTVCRRAERSLVALGRREAVGERARQYLNRLSDLLFVLGRALNRAAKRGDVLWQHERKKR